MPSKEPISLSLCRGCYEVVQHKHWLLEPWGDYCSAWGTSLRNAAISKKKEKLHNQKPWRDSDASLFPIGESELSPISNDETEFNLCKYEPLWRWGSGSGWERIKGAIIYWVLLSVMHACWIIHSIRKPYHWLCIEIPMWKVKQLRLTEVKRLSRSSNQWVKGVGFELRLVCTQSPNSSYHHDVPRLW